MNAANSPRAFQPPMVASFMREPDSTTRTQIPVPKAAQSKCGKETVQLALREQVVKFR